MAVTEPPDLVAWQVEQVRSCLHLLAAAPQEQAERLEYLGTSPMADGLALEFDDARPPVPGLIQRGRLPPAMEAAVEAIETRLHEMASDRSMWSTAALASTEWEDLRSLAKEGLSLVPDTHAGG